jgi:C4-dicarboxylate-specific signal transduction histidine kinase
MVNYLFIIDFNGNTLLTSQSVLEDTNRDIGYYEGRFFKDYLVDKDENFNLIESLLLTRSIENTDIDASQKTIEIELKQKNKSNIPVMILSTTLLKEFFDKQDLIFILCTDMRIQKRSQAMLIQSNKMASLGEMSSGLAHELNNPLTIMQGQLRRLESYISDEKITRNEKEKLIGKVQKNLERAFKIIKSFRTIARNGDSDPFLPVTIKSFVTEIKELTEKRLENNGISFNVLCNEETIIFNCKKPSLLQVFINIINNAVDAISDSPEKWIKVHIIKREKDVIFTIMDSGEGVSLENQIRLFEPFFTTKDIGKGTGLGLSISRGIVEDHLGSLNYSSSMRNSCFVIKIPLDVENS